MIRPGFPATGSLMSDLALSAESPSRSPLATEVAPHGITVNNILPGYTRTERLVALAQAASAREGITLDGAYARWESQIPMGRLGEPRELAALAAFLASERASYITAQSIAVDGGWIRSLY